MELDRRALLLSLASTAVVQVLPRGATAMAEGECFAVARRDDGGNFSAALFTLKGDVQAIELPQRGHERRVGRLRTAPGLPRRGHSARRASAGLVRIQARSPFFFGHDVFSADGKLLYTTENDYEHARGAIGVRDATGGYRQIVSSPLAAWNLTTLRCLATAVPW